MRDKREWMAVKIIVLGDNGFGETSILPRDYFQG